MKWDYVSAVVWGLDDVSLDGADRFTKSVGELALALGADDVELMGKLLNGYSIGYSIKRGGNEILKCLTGGAGDAKGSTEFISASTADEVYPVIKRLFKKHSISRLDAAEDFVGEGAFERLERILTGICTKRNISMSPVGEGHFRPDGTRDKTKGRTWYCGSKSSPFRVILYDKGIEQISKGIPDDPTRVRLEIRVRPKSQAKRMLCMVDNIMPENLYGMSSWGLELAEKIGVNGIPRMNIGSIWKPSEKEKAALTIVKMFSKKLDNLLEQEGSAEAVGSLLYVILEKYKDSKEALSQLA